MKKYFWILLLIPSLCWSATGDLQTIGGKVDTAITSIAGKAGTAIATICGKNYTDGDSTSCSAVTDYIGDTNIEASNDAATADRMYLSLYTPTCTSGCTSGNIVTMYLYHHDTDADNSKIFIYLDDGDDTPDTGDTLVYASGAVSSSAAEWDSIAVSGTVAVSCSSKYWVGFVSEGTWQYRYAATGTNYYKDSAGSYATVPNTIPDGGTSTTRGKSVYITVGP